MRHAFTSRQYAGEEDLLQTQGLLMDARARTDDENGLQPAANRWALA